MAHVVSDTIYKQLLRDISQVEQSMPLGQFNAAGVGGRASYGCVVHDAMELAAAVKAAIDAALPYEVIGAGTSVLFQDDEYAGLVIHNRSEGFVMATDRSQVVVESGMSLQRFITMAAGRGYGGMTQFYRERGTVGGAVYHELKAGGAALTSCIRHLTVLMPPTKMKPYPTVVRQRPDWLHREDGISRLRHIRETKGFAQPHPVILNVQFQLTSVRPDELQRRIQREASLGEKVPSGTVFGPLFADLEGEHQLAQVLKLSGVHKLSVGSVKPDRRNLNYLRVGKNATAAMVSECVAAMQELVRDRSGLELVQSFERVGIW